MARLPVQSQTVASGMDSTSDSVSMPLNRATKIINLQIDRLGVLRNNIRLVDQLPLEAANNPIDGVGYYYRATVRNPTPGGFVNVTTDLWLYVQASILHTAIPSVDPTISNSATDVRFAFGGITGYAGFGAFFQGKRVRFVSFLDETLMVQEGGLLMLRFYAVPTLGVGFYRAGFEPPTSSGAFPNLTLTTSGTGLTGTWEYELTFADERGRESSPTPPVSIALVNQGTLATWNTLYASPPTAYHGSNFVTAYLYRNTQGAPDTFYRVASATIAAMATSGNFAVDNATDASINGGTLAPNAGENDPPNAASIICIHKNRIFLNDVTDTSTLQVSNNLSATQFTALPTSPVAVTDGVRTRVGTDQGDAITALVEFGSVLAIFKRRGCYFLYGDNLSDFVIRPVYERGCISPDSASRCDNVVVFLSEDGIYAASYEAGDVVTKISKEIEVDLLSLPLDQRESSIGWFVDNCYFLSIGEIIFSYSFDVQGWTTMVLGRGGQSLLRANPPFPDSGTEGSVVVGTPVVPVVPIVPTPTTGITISGTICS